MKNADKPDFYRGCKCQQCGAIYKIDVIVDDAVWEKIKPKGKAEGAGLLCGSCILNRLEALNIGYSVVFIPERNALLKRVESLEAENEELRKALDEIVNPLKYIQMRAEQEGMQVNGYMASELSRSASYLKEIAERALRQPLPSKPE